MTSNLRSTPIPRIAKNHVFEEKIFYQVSCDRSVPEGSSSNHVRVVPKVEISAESIDPEEVDAWRTGMGEVKPPTSVVWVPPSFKPNHVPGCPSMRCPNGLAAIRHSCKIPESVEFRLPESGEVALSPPEGYFTCYEAYLMQCHLWFPILEIIVQLLNRFNLSISQVNPCGLQHLVGILVLSYELGITLDADHLEAWVEPRWSRSLIVQVMPRTNMAIISGFVSKYHFWKEHFFFVRVSDASVEASAIPIFRTRLGTKGIPNSECLLSLILTISDFYGLLTVWELLRGRPCFWAEFSPKRVCRAVGLYRSRFQPDMPTEEGSESSMDGFVPYVPRTKRDRSKPSKDKHIMVDEDVVDRQFSPDNILKDYLVSQSGGSNGDQFNLDGLSEFDFPPTAGGSEEGSDFSKAARMVNGGLLMINRALDTSRQEAQMARFRAEVADKEIARLKDDLESSRRHGRESFAKEVNHAYKRGKREIVEVMKSHRDKFSQSFEELKGCYKAFTDYRDCRGTVGGLCLTQHPDYSFSTEYAKQTGLMAEKDKDPKISEVEDEIWKQWEPVPVSPDTVEAETGGLDETGEVDKPVAPLDVKDYSIGGPMSENFDLGD
ncbi:hypothetical protein DY000_02060050 [Brassica cretica]|uniref:Aminotransferase-like plant mobile domain-containing protein n=1 Tax=Brassica cretica TaxID=69181 RepID=A0ABQ7B155_BRACR|nr:hypothetical protein DY000_02060050 [Brassica cretica]